MQNLIFVDFKTATTPTSGECLVEHYWTVDPAHGLAFVLVPGDPRPYPQCNHSQVVATRKAVEDTKVIDGPKDAIVVFAAISFPIYQRPTSWPLQVSERVCSKGAWTRRALCA